MPSTLIGAHSGGVQLISGGNYSSGVIIPRSILQLRAGSTNSGYAYIGFSGGLTITSGGYLSSGGLLDGMELAPGDVYAVPKLMLQNSGLSQVYATCASTVSGFVRIFWEPM